eukprot:CAMPEP_0182906482 /NCGR_PEP_ID=MMETSP0034_2-20130328/33770_1 /TAXON_ID=156128 /ORGANISM="Nephroselmis pyriformis, Strain CCMP717" /LENGTH=52 /DNA_ID=CAMNT_0025042161 /DNA_START=359 /DNA_END=514 /DNA_ORIENTATION=+
MATQACPSPPPGVVAASAPTEQALGCSAPAGGGAPEAAGGQVAGHGQREEGQ